MAENMRPFALVKDRGFLSLMKTGRPHYKIPSPTTLARDSRQVFLQARRRVAHLISVRRALMLSVKLI